MTRKETKGRPAGTLSGDQGFTLLELIVVVFILGLLVSIVAPRFMGRTEEAQIESTKVQIRNFESALNLFRIDNAFYPTTEQGLEALVQKPSTGREAKNYREGGYLNSRSVPNDPWGNPYVYISPGLNGDFDIISLGADGVEGGEGVDADIHNWEIQ